MSATSDRGRLLHDGVSKPASAWRTKLSNPSRRSLSTRETLSPWEGNRQNGKTGGLHEKNWDREGAGDGTVWRLVCGQMRVFRRRQIRVVSVSVVWNIEIGVRHTP